MNRRTFLKFLAGAFVVSAPTTHFLLGLLKKAELTHEQVNSLHYIRHYEAVLSRQKGFSHSLHNELRHYWGSFSELRSLHHADVILGHCFLDNYIMHILADWHDTHNEYSYDLDLAVDSLDRRAQAYPQLQFVQAACWMRAGQICLDRQGLFEQAKNYFERVANIDWHCTDQELVAQAGFYRTRARGMVRMAAERRQSSFEFDFVQMFDPGITG
jgi:hypothetical protein